MASVEITVEKKMEAAAALLEFHVSSRVFDQNPQNRHQAAPISTSPASNPAPPAHDKMTAHSSSSPKATKRARSSSSEREIPDDTPKPSNTEPPIKRKAADEEQMKELQEKANHLEEQIQFLKKKLDDISENMQSDSHDTDDEQPQPPLPEEPRKNGKTKIGGKAWVSNRVLKQIEGASYTYATRKLLMEVFPRSVLATHSLSGTPSPAFPNIPAKKKLDPELVNDIILFVCDKCNVHERHVRNIITTKCADESKMSRMREGNSKKKSEDGEEDIKPSKSSGSAAVSVPAEI